MTNQLRREVINLYKQVGISASILASHLHASLFSYLISLN